MSRTRYTSARENCSAVLGYNPVMGTVRALLCVALVATGCYSPSFEDCKVSCASGNGCPDGFSCISGVCRLGGRTGACLAPPDDGGTDGPDDDSDGGPEVADEDMDGILDADDLCPISGNNADADGDGVGDACEPIASGDDSIILFEGFHGTSAPAGAVVLGNWTFSGGKAHVTSAANVASAVLFTIDAPITDRETILGHVTVDGLFSTPSNVTGAGVVTRDDSTGDQGVQCGIGRDVNTGTDHLLLVKVGSGADTYMMSNPSLATQGTSATLPITRNPTNDIHACNQNGTSTVAFAPSMPVPNGPLAGIRTRSMSASFDWVMIIRTQ
jgi:hypothetical protein